MTELSESTAHSPFLGVSVVDTFADPAPSNSDSDPSLDSNLHSLAALWARKYMLSVLTRDTAEGTRNHRSIEDFASHEGRLSTAEQLGRSLTLASAQAWSKTETLLAKEVQRHAIEQALINPWHIADDSHKLFQSCLGAYAQGVTPQRLSVIVGPAIGQMRQKYTANDPRTLGFVSMQFHYTGVMLLEQLSPAEKMLFAPYLKVMDDHLYMPLREAYQAAATYELDALPLMAVQQLLPLSTRIAHAVCDQVSRLHPDYESYSGALSAAPVQVSSIRDVEMFQVYLCLCVLENSIRSIKQELFPLCVILYPSLRVKWQLVQEMLQAIGGEMIRHLSPNHLAIFLPYLKTLNEIFSIDVLQKS